MIDIDAIQARAEKATTGPWFVEHGRVHSGEASSFDTVALASMLGSRVWLPDAEFIARARTDVPDLIAEVRALRAERDALAAREAQVRAVVEDVPRWRGYGAQRPQLVAILDAAPAVSLAQHDAEVWDEGAEYSVGYSTAPLYDNPYREETS